MKRYTRISCVSPQAPAPSSNSTFASVIKINCRGGTCSAATDGELFSHHRNLSIRFSPLRYQERGCLTGKDQSRAI